MLVRAFFAFGAILVFSLGGAASNSPSLNDLATAQAGAGKLKFEIYQDAAKEYRWRLKGTDDKLLATAGQGYSAKADCRKGVERMMTSLDKEKFEVYEDKGKDFRWRLKASNGQIVAASSGGYPTMADCDKAIDLIKKGVSKAEVIEEKAK
jgi:uncharacterized protein YegP (UPF0339 family)